jgi:glutamate-1-semialdehyde 2,1-aminomutase/spore coat polysaccharide biosynthesis protein SpsF
MTKVIGVVQGRMSSQRLPGKVLKPLAGLTSLEWVIRAGKHANQIDEVVIATSTEKSDDPIAKKAKELGVPCFRGSLDDVLSRYLGVAENHHADYLVRLLCDCPFLDPAVIDETIKLREMADADYCSNSDPATYPDGLDTEVFSRHALEVANREAIRGTDRDCVTRFIVRNRDRFRTANLVCPLPRLDRERWVLDSPEDHKFLSAIAEAFGGSDTPPSYVDILSFLDRNPAIRKLQPSFTRNERFFASLATEKVIRTYSRSHAHLKTAETMIPLGAQTFSKSKLMFPEGQAPLFVTHGDGAYVFDVDGNDYVDLVGGLLPNILGYRDPDVDRAIREQLDRGISFSLATPLEEELAAKLNFHIPSAEMIRFGKNGSDVTSAAVRLARHITGRNKVMAGGYHGWHDWAIAQDIVRNKGVPGQVRDQTVKSLEQVGLDKLAAVVIEPEYFYVWHGDKANDELSKFCAKCRANGALVIFDEIVSGFRLGIGGLQERLGVTPDLSCFGKAMGNGMPISALVGKADYMEQMTEISYSGTFFGETLSIAASIATIDKLSKQDIPQSLARFGEDLREGIDKLIKKSGVSGIELYSYPELNRIRIRDDHHRALFMQEMAANGVLIINSHNTNFAMKHPEMDRILLAWDKTLHAIKAGKKLGGVVKRGHVR